MRARYQRREPEKTALHQVVSEHLESFLRYTRDNYKRPLPRYVEVEFRRFVRCGVAVIRRHDVIERILRHLALPLGPTALGHPDTIAYDVTGEPMPDWVTGVDPAPPDAVERAPPSQFDCVDPPAPDD